jgi:hypothetical protein
MVRSLLKLSATLSLLLIRIVIVQAQTDEKVLRGLDSIEVDIEEINNEDAKHQGITKEQLQTDVELRLRTLGIKVSPHGAPAPSTSPFLYVILNFIPVITTKHETFVYAYNIDVHFVDIVNIARSKKNSDWFFATTWSTGGVSYVNPDELASIRHVVIDRVDKFANAYLAANPEH